jgi:hypothetical protein
MIFGHVANGPSWSTGLALLNTSTTTDAVVQVSVMRKTGALVGSASFVLSRGTKQAQFLTDWVPASNADDGFVFVQSLNNVALHGLELFFSRDFKVIANVAPGALDPAIPFQPPLTPPLSPPSATQGGSPPWP